METGSRGTTFSTCTSCAGLFEILAFVVGWFPSTMMSSATTPATPPSANPKRMRLLNRAELTAQRLARPAGGNHPGVGRLVAHPAPNAPDLEVDLAEEDP